MVGNKLKGLLLINLLFVFMIVCSPSNHEAEAIVPDDEDIVWGDMRDNKGGIEGNRKRKYIDVSQLSKVELGKTTEKELYNLFSRDINIRLSYNPVMPRKHQGVYKPVDKKITYDGADIVVENIEGGQRYTANSSLVAIFFLYKGILLYCDEN